MGLALTRKVDAAIIIEHAGERCVVTPRKISGGQVMLVFDAPHTFTIHREEIQARVDGAK